MTQMTTVDAVIRTLADPTRRAVFERIVKSEEITVAELTRGSGVTQSAISQHLRSLKQAGLIADRPEGRNVHYRADPKGLAPLVDWMAPLRRLLARALCQSQNTLKGDRSMTEAPKNTATQDIVVEEVLPHAPETIWKTLTTGEMIDRWLMKSTGFEPVKARASHCRPHRPAHGMA